MSTCYVFYFFRSRLAIGISWNLLFFHSSTPETGKSLCNLFITLSWSTKDSTLPLSLRNAVGNKWYWDWDFHLRKFLGCTDLMSSSGQARLQMLSLIWLEDWQRGGPWKIHVEAQRRRGQARSWRRRYFGNLWTWRRNVSWAAQSSVPDKVKEELY